MLWVRYNKHLVLHLVILLIWLKIPVLFTTNVAEGVATPCQIFLSLSRNIDVCHKVVSHLETLLLLCQYSYFCNSTTVPFTFWYEGQKS